MLILGDRMVVVRNLVFPSLIFLCCLNFYRMYYCFRKPQNQQRQLFFIIPLVSSGFNKCLHMVDQASHYFSRSLLHLFHPFPNTRPTDLPTLLRKKKKSHFYDYAHLFTLLSSARMPSKLLLISHELCEIFKKVFY